jgi:ELWxxDGT repeat protein
MKPVLILTIIFCSLMGKAQNISNVKYINPGASSAHFGPMVSYGSKLVFTAFELASGNELWSSDGTTSGTNRIVDLIPGNSSGVGSNLFFLEDEIYFFGDNGTNGSELWVTDGTEAGTRMVKDIVVGAESSQFNMENHFVALNGILYFTLDSGGELWRSDGTAAGTVMVKSFEVASGIPSDFSISNLAVANGKIWFTGAKETAAGKELWTSDGTTAGTIMVKDINPGDGGSYPFGYTWALGKLFFIANDGLNGPELWVTDGTSAGTMMVKNINQATIIDNFNPEIFIAYKGAIYFNAYSKSNYLASGLWKSDGTEAGTVLVKESLRITQMMELNNKLVFSAWDSTNGDELWTSDGTSNGTHLLKDIYPGKTSGFGLARFQGFYGKLYFAAKDSLHGSELWRTDGTTEGTIMVGEINAGKPDSSPNDLIVAGNVLFFTANALDEGIELYKYTLSTGLTHSNSVDAFSIFPNPATQNLNISGSTQISSITFTDMSGRTTHSFENLNIERVNLPLNEVKPGVYFVSIFSEGGTFTKKLIVNP